MPKNGLLGRLQRAGAHSLNDAKHDQQRQRAHHSAKRRADDEKNQRGHVNAFLSEEPRQKPGQRHDHHGGDDESSGHPRHLLDSDAERAHEMRHGDIDNGGVNRSHQCSERDGHGDQPLVD